MGFQLGPLLILLAWLAPVLYIGVRGRTIPDHGGWLLLAVLGGPFALALFLAVRAVRPAA